MINNPTPEEKAWWDREMDGYLKKRVASPARAAVIIFVFISLIAGVATCHVKRDQPSVEQQLNDTLFKDHSEIRDSVQGEIGKPGDPWHAHEEHSEKADTLETAAFSTRATRATRTKQVDSLVDNRPEEDSIVFRNNNVSLMMYHAGNVVAMRPNKTWHWLVLDSLGYNIAIVKAKRRDTL